MIRSGIWTTYNEGSKKISSLSSGTTYIYSGSTTTWTPPENVYSITFETWGGGGKGGQGTVSETEYPGGGGGAYSRATIYPTGVTTYTLRVGQGSTNGNIRGGDTVISADTIVYCSAIGGTSIPPNVSGSGGPGGDSIFGVGDVRRSGGDGGNGSTLGTGGGGSGAGSNQEANDGGQAVSGGAGGAAASEFGGKGGDGGNASIPTSSSNGQNASNYGGGGGGAYRGTSGSPTGGNGGQGLIRINYTVVN